MNPDHLYPYLVPGLPDPGWEPIAVPVGHGVWARLFEDTESAAGVVHAAVAPDRLRAAGLTPAEAHGRALANLARFAEDSPDLSIQVLGNAGDPVHFLLYSDHPRAAACLLLPDLYEEACDLLKTTDVCAVVPQWESLVVLPKRDRAYRDAVVAKLRELEADAVRPIGFALFELTAAGVREFHEG
ncbi:MAG TPA: hypothetical protein VH092_07760 [Urbifossiella sp.]|nr:hypothetical protein [Urbifossiella sp.]